VDIDVAFWNLENLFDTTDDPIANDFDFTPEQGWTPATQAAKIENLAAVIDDMFSGTGPDLLGICEVENEPTLQKLVDAVTVRDDLRVLPFEDGPDVRGIDCGLIYSNEVFEPASSIDGVLVMPQSHVVHNRYPTRDIFEVPLRVIDNDAALMVYVNHWPSRARGRFETEPLRIAAANHLGRLIDRHLEFTSEELVGFDDTEVNMERIQDRWNRNVLVMGDFNDEPFDRSVLAELRASSGFDKLEEPVKTSGGNEYLPGSTAYAELQATLFNCMWPVAAVPDRGSLFFSEGIPTMNLLDQFIVSRGLYYGFSNLRMKRRAIPTPGDEPYGVSTITELPTVDADVFDSDLMITSEEKRRPKEFTFSVDEGGLATHNDGFSDHFPIQTTIQTL